MIRLRPRRNGCSSGRRREFFVNDGSAPGPFRHRPDFYTPQGVHHRDDGVVGNRAVKRDFNHAGSERPFHLVNRGDDLLAHVWFGQKTRIGGMARRPVQQGQHVRLNGIIAMFFGLFDFLFDGINDQGIIRCVFHPVQQRPFGFRLAGIVPVQSHL